MKLEARNVSFRYDNGNRNILNHMDLSMESGESLGLAAPSGFGKTTFLKILAGYETPDEGGVFLDGKPLSAYRGYCPVQMIWQHPETAVDPLLRLGETLYEAGPVEDRLLDALHIQPAWLERYPLELSGGELQRFCIARALREGVRYLLCDEITAMLDLITQAQIWDFLLEEARQRELGLVIVSHNTLLLERLCTRIEPLT